MRFAVGCRGSAREGLGHLYRAYSFARAASAGHEVSVVVLAERDFAPIFSDLGSPVSFVADEGEFAAAMTSIGCDAAMLDMIDLGDAAFSDIRRAARVLASISPVFRKAGQLDLLFSRGDVSPVSGPVVYAGLPYAIVNAFCEPIPDLLFRQAAAAKALPVMVSFGGGDADNHTRLVLEALRDVEEPLLIWLMLGDGYAHSQDELTASARSAQRHEMVLARTNRSMWRIAANCAVGVLTGGMSSLEAIYAGLPVVSVKRGFADSIQVGADYDRATVDGGSIADGSYVRIGTIISELSRNRDRLLRMRQAQAGLVDGLGAERIIDIVERYCSDRHR